MKLLREFRSLLVSRDYKQGIPAGFKRLIALGFLLSFLGCSSERDSRTEIVFWAMGREGEEVAKLMPEFERRHPDIKVRVQMIPWQAAHEKLLTSFAGSSLPDMCQLGNTWVPEFHLLNAIENLAPYVEQSTSLHPDNFFGGIWDTYVIDSAVYGIPWYVDTRLLFYRTDLLANVGYKNPPKSWAEWFDASAKLSGKNPERFGMFIPTNNEFQPPIIMGVQKGSALLKDNNTRGNFSGTEFRAALTDFHQFFQNRWAPVKTNQIANVYQPFAEGYFAMYITGPWNINEFQKRLPTDLQDKWMTAPLPGPDGNIGVSLAGGSGLVMFRTSRHKEKVWKVIEYLSEPEVQLQFYRIATDMPSRIEAWNDSSLANNKYARAFYTQLNHVVATPKIPEWEQIAQKVREYAELVSMNRLTVDAATIALDKDVDQMLEKRRWMMYER
jgi:multiple sugar transport system substrate-binding protein